MKTILVVDDEYAMVEALSALLEDEGYQVATAANGEEALLCLSDGLTPDAVLLDVMMPKLDGREVLRQLRADPKYSAIPVILMSAASVPLSGEPMRDTIFLPKPFDLPRLLRVLSSIDPKET
jgi:CheY-like chemotaxis protein